MNDHVPALRRWWLFCLTGVILLFLVFPVFIVIPLSFSASSMLEFPPRQFSLRWYENFLGSAEWVDAAILSLKVAVLSTIMATVLGVAAAYGLLRSGFRLAQGFQAILLAPLLVPVILIAIGIFYLYALLGLNNTLVGLVLAHALLSMPFVIVSASVGLRTFDLAQENAAISLGASRFQAFRRVTLPQIGLSVLSGAVLAFIASLDEVMVSLFISGGEMSTLPRRMFNSLRDEIDPTIAAISVMLIALSVLAVLLLLLAGRDRKAEHD